MATPPGEALCHAAARCVPRSSARGHVAQRRGRVGALSGASPRLGCGTARHGPPTGLKVSPIPPHTSLLIPPVYPATERCNNSALFCFVSENSEPIAQPMISGPMISERLDAHHQPSTHISKACRGRQPWPPATMHSTAAPHCRASAPGDHRATTRTHRRDVPALRSAACCCSSRLLRFLLRAAPCTDQCFDPGRSAQ